MQEGKYRYHYLELSVTWKVHMDFALFDWSRADRTLETLDRYSDGSARLYSSTFVLKDYWRWKKVVESHMRYFKQE